MGNKLIYLMTFNQFNYGQSVASALKDWTKLASKLSKPKESNNTKNWAIQSGLQRVTFPLTENPDTL